MKFNHILGNPPYDRSLHLKILKETMNHVDFKKGGEIVWLHPDGWINNQFMDYNSSAIEKEFAENKNNIFSDIEFIRPDTSNKIFDINAWNGLCISIWKTTTDPVNADDFKVKDPLLIKILDKIYKLPSLRSRFDKNKELNYSISVRRTTHGNLPFAELNSKATQKIYFNTENELNNFIEYSDWQKFKFWKFMHMKWIHAENSAEFPFMQDYTKPWTDERFYEYFKLTPEEIKLIEETMK